MRKHTIYKSIKGNYLKLIIAIIISPFLAACGKEEPGGDPPAARTVMVWLAGDNNLYSEVPSKISAITQGFVNSDNDNCRLMVYADYRGHHPQLIEIDPQGNQLIIETYPAQNSASSETLRRVMLKMREIAPAQKYGLIVFSHATGWLPKGALENPSMEDKTLSRTVCDDNGEQMPLSEFAEAIPADLNLDYIVFENCFMSGVEVAQALQGKAHRILASSAEILSPGFQELYGASFEKLLSSTPDLSGFASDYYLYRMEKSGNYRSATVSVLNLDRMPALTALARSIIPQSDGLTEEEMETMQRFNRHSYTLFFDLEEYLTAIAPERKAEIREAIGEVVEYRSATPEFMPTYSNGFRISKHCGLTVYIPQPGFPLLNQEYEKTDWYKTTRPTRSQHRVERASTK